LAKKGKKKEREEGNGSFLDAHCLEARSLAGRRGGRKKGPHCRDCHQRTLPTRSPPLFRKIQEPCCERGGQGEKKENGKKRERFFADELGMLAVSRKQEKLALRLEAWVASPYVSPVGGGGGKGEKGKTLLVSRLFFKGATARGEKEEKKRGGFYVLSSLSCRGGEKGLLRTLFFFPFFLGRFCLRGKKRKRGLFREKGEFSKLFLFVPLFLGQKLKGGRKG